MLLSRSWAGCYRPEGKRHSLGKSAPSHPMSSRLHQGFRNVLLIEKANPYTATAPSDLMWDKAYVSFKHISHNKTVGGSCRTNKPSLFNVNEVAHSHNSSNSW